MLLNDLLKYLTPREVLNYARARQVRTYVGPALFPETPVNELSFEYWKTINRVPVMASFQAFGAEAEIGSREGADKVIGEIPPIKRKMPLNERLLIALKREGIGDIDLIKNQIFNDLDSLLDSTEARIEKVRMDAISKGVVSLSENGVIMNVDYKVPNTHKAVMSNTDTSDGFWSFAKAEPITYIGKWVDTIVADSGYRPQRALTSNTVVSQMCRNASVRQAIYGDFGGTRPVTLPQINMLLAGLQLPQIATYDLQVRAQAENGSYSQFRFFPENMFVLLPDSVLGDTLVGPTAESLLSSDIASKEAAGVYATVQVLTEPVGLWTKVAKTAFPTFPMADTVFQAQVLA